MSEDELIRRVFPVELTPSGDGRTLELRVVPYNTVARVSDGGDPYDEEWAPGVFDKQLNAANRVLVNVEHEQGFGGVVGRGAEFRESSEGFDGSFRILQGPDGDKALELVNEGILTGVSLEARPLKSERTALGVMRRLKAQLLNIALTRYPAFPQAQVLAVREEPPEEPEPEEPQPEPERRSQVDELLERVGFQALVSRAVVRGPWDGSASRFDDEQWRRSCILDRGDQFDTAKTRYALPVLEPGGDLNVNAMHAAAAVLAGGRGGVNAPAAAKAAAARRLRRYYGMAGEEMPPAMVAMAGRS
jgi:HK97 family phage prohead protease